MKISFKKDELGRPLGYLIFSLMALIGDPMYYFFSKGFRGQPRSMLKTRFGYKKGNADGKRHVEGSCAHFSAPGYGQSCMRSCTSFPSALHTNPYKSYLEASGT